MNFVFKLVCFREDLGDQIVLLNSKVDELEKQREEMTRNFEAELERTKRVVRKEMEAEHLVKFSQVSKQIQCLQKSELDSMKTALQEEYSKDLGENTGYTTDIRQEIKSCVTASLIIREV